MQTFGINKWPHTLNPLEFRENGDVYFLINFHGCVGCPEGMVPSSDLYKFDDDGYGVHLMKGKWVNK